MASGSHKERCAGTSDVLVRITASYMAAVCSKLITGIGVIVLENLCSEI